MAYIPLDSPEENVPPFHNLDYHAEYVSSSGAVAVIVLVVGLVFSGLGTLVYLFNQQSSTATADQAQTITTVVETKSQPPSTSALHPPSPR